MGKNKIITIGTPQSDLALLEPFYIDSVFSVVSQLSFEYPNFGKWFYEKVVPGIASGKRKILLHTVEDRISGVVILKDDVNEKKICTVRVHPAFRRQGIGKMLIKKSFDLLETEKPIITVSSKRFEQFSGLLKYYGFKLEGKFEGFYMPDVTEYAFNGDLISSEKFRNMRLNLEQRVDLPPGCCFWEKASQFFSPPIALYPNFSK